MKKRINVTQRDIKKGYPTPGLCPIARAIKRHVVPSCLVGVVGPVYKAVIGGAMIPLPNEAITFVLHFDTHRLVEPFSFPLDIPDEALRP